VEGITEFLPVSSTGHLILSGEFLHFDAAVGGKAKAECFEIVIQLGAIAAIVVLYFRRFLGLLDFRKKTGFAGLRGIWLLFLTSLPAVVAGLGCHAVIRKHLFNAGGVTAALFIGAIGILFAEWWSARKQDRSQVRSLDDVTWKEALAIGCFQCFALWPGMSRSASTIVGGMLFRLDRKTAALYSFFAAAPILFAASAKELYENRALLSAADFDWFMSGFVVSFIVAWLAVRTFIHLLSTWTLRPFAWYRIALAVLLGILFWSGVLKWD
jgi:undecaprenyl-diphosphatase